MKPFTIDVDPANVDADGIADGNSSADASVTLDGTLTSGGAFTSADGLAHKLIITDAGGDDQSGATYTITGTDANGDAQVENIVGPTSSGSVTTTKHFLSVSSVAIASAAAGSTVDIGTVDEVETKIYPIDRVSREALRFNLTETGAMNYALLETFQNPFVTDKSTLDFTEVDDAISNYSGSVSQHASAIKVRLTSYTDTAELQVNCSQGI